MLKRKKLFQKQEQKKFNCCGTLIPIVSKRGEIIGAVCNMCKKEYPAQVLTASHYSTR